MISNREKLFFRVAIWLSMLLTVAAGILFLISPKAALILVAISAVIIFPTMAFLQHRLSTMGRILPIGPNWMFKAVEEDEFVVSPEEIVFLKAVRATGRKVNECRECRGHMPDGDISGMCEKCADRRAY